MLLLVIIPLAALAIWGIPVGARAIHRESATPIGWMSAEWLAEHRASHAH
jgi:hypothetical protein